MERKAKRELASGPGRETFLRLGLLYTAQLLLWLALGALCLFVGLSLRELQAPPCPCLDAEEQRASGPLPPPRANAGTESGSESGTEDGAADRRRRSAAAQQPSPLLWPMDAETLVSRQTLVQACYSIHDYCGKRERKLRGPPGSPGRPGRRGEQGGAGSLGLPGTRGLRGQVGPHGSVGPPGRDGVCNCSLPEIFLHQVTLPPKTILKTVTVPIPQVIIKEITVHVPVPYPNASFPPGFTLPPTVVRRRNITQLMPKPVPTVPLASNESLASGNVSSVANETSGEVMGGTGETTVENSTARPTRRGDGRCYLEAVGIPILHAESQYGSPLGAWMRDSAPLDEEKRWLTDTAASEILYEYADERALLNKAQRTRYYADFLAAGTGGLIHGGAYFYHRHGSRLLVRYDLANNSYSSVRLPALRHADCPHKDKDFRPCNASDRDPWLFGLAHNYVDLGVDDSGGLWAVYLRGGGLGLALLDPPSLTLRQTFVVPHGNLSSLANTFVICGVLYGLDSSQRDARIDFAFDLRRRRQLPVSLAWYSPYGALTQLHYNPHDSRLYFYDGGFLLSANLRFSSHPPVTPSPTFPP